MDLYAPVTFMYFIGADSCGHIVYIHCFAYQLPLAVYIDTDIHIHILQ